MEGASFRLELLADWLRALIVVVLCGVVLVYIGPEVVISKGLMIPVPGVLGSIFLSSGSISVRAL